MYMLLLLATDQDITHPLNLCFRTLQHMLFPGIPIHVIIHS